ncbi:hypothetical protein OURE66S_01804 [Oligella ureolytica]
MGQNAQKSEGKAAPTNNASGEAAKEEGGEGSGVTTLSKPFSPKELMARIKAVLRRRAPQLTTMKLILTAYV